MTEHERVRASLSRELDLVRQRKAEAEQALLRGVCVGHGLNSEYGRQHRAALVRASENEDAYACLLEANDALAIDAGEVSP